MRQSLNRKLVVAILTFFLAISVGYAIFSETITIEGTASAQGNFDISASCYPGVAPTGNYDYSYLDLLPEHDYSNDNCQVNGDNVSFSTSFTNGLARRYFTIKLTNTGTIAAKVSMDDLTKSSSMIYCIDGKNGEKNDFFEDSECASDTARPMAMNYANMSVLVKPDGTEIVNNEENLNELVSNFLTANGELKLEPGASAYVIYAFTYDSGYTYVKGTGTYTFNFEQLEN